jgi:hypothetical protein
MPSRSMLLSQSVVRKAVSLLGMLLVLLPRIWLVKGAYAF